MITFKKIVCATFFLCFSMLLKMFITAKERNVIQHHLNIASDSSNLKRLKVFFISDIHRRKIDGKLIRKLDSDIDIVIIGGDIAEKNVPLSRIAENMKILAQLGQVYYVWGNNDREVGEDAIRKIILQNDGLILDNENMPIKNISGWGICGTDDPSCRMINVEKSMNNISKYRWLIFVSHQPSVWKRAEEHVLPDLMLAGHTHGGQIRLGKYGIGEKGSFTVIQNRGKLISNGYGTTSLPLRLGAKPECHIITIEYNEAE